MRRWRIIGFIWMERKISVGEEYWIWSYIWMFKLSSYWNRRLKISRICRHRRLSVAIAVLDIRLMVNTL